jgi:hypothetical protein
MALQLYKIATAEVGSAGTTNITFNSIPQGYTDLKLVISSRDDRSGQQNGDVGLQVGYNGTINTSSIYTMRRIGGTGSSVFSDSGSGTAMSFGMSTSTTATANTFGSSEYYIPNYTSSVSKSASAEGVAETNATATYAVLNACLMATNNPITDIKLYPALATNFVQYTTATLYGIL